MVERAARVAAPAALALFAALGVLMTSRPPAAALTTGALTALIGVVLAWRLVTGWPLMVGLAAAALALTYLGHGQAANLAWMGMCVVAAWVALTSATAVAIGAAAVLAAVPVVQWVLDPSEPGWAAWFVGTAFTTVSCVFARRLRLTVDQLRAAQGELAERTRAEERSRIAAEVHDVIGHALTVSLLHVSSARLALDEDPEEARRSLDEAERLARASLEEVRATVGMVRADGSGPSAPLPGARDIRGLVGSFQRAGSEIDLVAGGDVGAVGAARGLAAYRIVQEALTNATKHAPGHRVTVRVESTDGVVRVRVHNRGAVPAIVEPGSGLRGMQERAESVGGQLHAGPDGDGWLVEAVLPT